MLFPLHISPHLAEKGLFERSQWTNFWSSDAENITAHARARNIYLFHVTVVRVITLVALAPRLFGAAYGRRGTQQELRQLSSAHEGKELR